MMIPTGRICKVAVGLCSVVCVILLCKLTLYSRDPTTFDGWKALQQQDDIRLTFGSKRDIFKGKKYNVSRGHMFAVMSCRTPTDNNYNSVFYLPLTALAWERFGYRSVVLITGKQETWENDDTTLRIALNFLKQRDAVIIFVDSTDDALAAATFKVLPIFAVNFRDFTDADYLITVGWNQWPLSREIFLLPAEKDVILVNYNCCGTFQWKKEKHVALSLLNIGASAQKWREIIATGNGVRTDNTEGIFKYLKREFGENVTLGDDNIQWNMDEAVASVKYKQWMKRKSSARVAFVTRDVTKDRIFGKMKVKSKVPNPNLKNDTILVDYGYREGTWAKLVRPLLWQMYGEGSRPHRWCEEYVLKFRNTFSDRVDPHGEIKYGVQMKDLFNHIVGGLL